jgi:4-hydroxybenzoyl-CoA thioesterase
MSTQRSNVISITVEFGDCDPAQIVFYPNFFKWFDAGTRHFFAACGVPSWQAMRVTHGIIGTPLVDASAKFLGAVTYGDTIELITRPEEWKRSSFIMAHEIRKGGVLVVQGREVRVFAGADPDDPARIRAVPIPKDVLRMCAG